MPFAGSQITVTSAATLLADGTRGSVNDPVPVVVRNTDAALSVFLGGSGVTTAGYELKPGVSLFLGLVGDVLYAIAASTSVRVDVLKGRQ